MKEMKYIKVLLLRDYYSLDEAIGDAEIIARRYKREGGIRIEIWPRWCTLYGSSPRRPVRVITSEMV